MDMRYLTRNVNEGFSGGEKKRNEILQARALDTCHLRALAHAFPDAQPRRPHAPLTRRRRVAFI